MKFLRSATACIFDVVSSTLRSVLIGILLWSIALPGATAATFEIRIDPGRAFHSFAIVDGNSEPYTGFSNLSAGLIEDGTNSTSYASISVTDPPASAPLKLLDQQTGHVAPLNLDAQSGSGTIGSWQGDPRIYIVGPDPTLHLALEQSDGSLRLLAYSGMGETTTGAQRFEYSGPYDPAQAFRVINLSARQGADWGQTNLATATWSALGENELLAEVTIYFGPTQAGLTFTLAVGDFESGAVNQVVAATPALGTTSIVIPGGGQTQTYEAGEYSVATVFLPRGTEFYIERQIDHQTEGGGSAIWHHVPFSEGLNVHASAFSVISAQTITVFVSTTLAGQDLSLQHPWGSTSLTPTEEVNWILDYTQDGFENNFEYRVYTADIIIPNGEQPAFWVVDSEGIPLTTSAGDLWVYDGWNWIGGEPWWQIPQNYAFSFELPAASTETFVVVSPSGLTWPLSEFTPIGDATVLDAWHQHEYPLAMVAASLTINEAPQTIGDGPWHLRQNSTGREQPISPGSHNVFRGWLPLGELLGFQISLTRWGHDLRVRCADGSEYPIEQFFSQGEISPELLQQAHAQPHLYFEGNGFIQPGVNFWVWDATTGEESPWNTTYLQNWACVQPPSVLSAQLTNDDKAVRIAWQAAGGASEHLIERRVNGAVQQIGTVPGGAVTASYDFDDLSPVSGSTNYYRIITRFGDRHSAPSQEANVAVPQKPGFRPDVPPQEQDLNDGRFASSSALRNPWIPPGGLGVTVSPQGNAAALNLAAQVPPPLGDTDWEMRVHQYTVDATEEGGAPYPDRNPSKVDITFKGTHLQNGVVIERRTPDGPWEGTGTCNGINNTFTDSVEHGKLYYYRLRAFNGAGVSPPTGMKRWIPPLWLDTKAVFRNAVVSEGDPASTTHDIFGAYHDVFEVQTSPVQAGDAINALPSFPSDGLAIHHAWPNMAEISNDFESSSDYAHQARHLLTPASATRDVMHCAGNSKLSLLMVQAEEESETWEELKEFTITSQTFSLELDPMIGATRWAQRAPALIGEDSFTVPDGSGYSPDDPRQSKDWGHELFYKQDGPKNQVSIRLSGSAHFTANNNIILSGESVSRFTVYGFRSFEDEFGNQSIQRVVVNSGGTWNNFTHLEVVPNLTGPNKAQIGDSIKVRVHFLPGPPHSNGAAIVYDEILVTYFAETERCKHWEFSAEEATGSRYRRVDLTGRPRPDVLPEGKTERDFPAFGTYIDALTLQLHHELNDLAIPVPGSDLGLRVSRRWKSPVWHTVRDLLPDRNLFQPFGPGWSSSLGVNMKIVAVPGQQTFAYVTDYAGAVHRFVLTSAHWELGNDGKYPMWEKDADDVWHWASSSTPWVSLPSGSHEGTIDGETLSNTTFRTKHGTEIEFEPIAGIENVVVGYSPELLATIHSYLRPKWIKDAAGNKLIFQYGGINHPMPEKIYFEASPDLALSIQYDSFNRVRKVWDPKGQAVEYVYASLPGLSAGPLQRVIAGGKTLARYEYELSYEADRRPRSDGEPPAQYGHIDLRKISDGLENGCAFEYAFDVSRAAFHSAAGPYIQSGLPRLVASSTLTDAPQSAIFTRISEVALQPNAADPATVELQGTRATQVTDANGGIIRYNFLDHEAHVVDPLLYVADPNRHQSFPPIILIYKTMEVDYGSGMRERLEFNPQASLALSKFTDFSGKTTIYGYAETVPWKWESVRSLSPTLGIWATFYDDPTFVEDSTGARQEFAYNFFRQKVGTLDKTGRITAGNNWGSALPTEIRSWKRPSGHLDYQFSFATIPAGAPYEQTLLQYSPTFPGVAIQKTVKYQGESLPWAATDLVTRCDLDERGNPKIEWSGDWLVARKTYDRNGNCTSITDGRGFRTTCIYDHRNRLTRTYFPSPDGGALVFREVSYDAGGNKVSETDERGNQTSYSYDRQNRLIKEMRGGDAPTWTEHQYDALGSRIATLDSLGTTTTRQFDSLRRLKRVVEASGTPETRATEYHYPARFAGTDSVPESHDGNGLQPTKVVDSRGYITRHTYDDLHRLETTSVAYATPGQDPVTAAHTATTEWFYDAEGRVTLTFDPLGKGTTTSYDHLGRVDTVTFANTKTTKNYYTSTGLKWKVKDEAGNFSESHFDSAGRMVKELGPILANQTRPETGHTYDRSGNVALKQVLVTPGQTSQYSSWKYLYDGRNRKVAEIGPGVETGPSVTQWAYDDAGNVVATQDPRGKTTTRTYNSRNQVRFVTHPQVRDAQGAFVFPVTETRYDSRGNITQVIDAEGRVTANTYDPHNRLKTTTDHAGIVVSYGYDRSDNRVSVTDGKLQTTTFTYDGLKRVLTDQPPTGPPRVHTYDACNRIRYNDGNGAEEYFSYDDRHRLAARAKAGHQRQYFYDDNGRLTQVLDADPLATVDYAYDAAGRLISESSLGCTHSYEYDLAGNRVATHYGNIQGGIRRSITSHYDAAGRLKAMLELEAGFAPELARATSYFYDANGNILSKQLPNGVKEISTYDALNRRRVQVLKHGDTVLTTHEQLYDQTGNVRTILEQVEGEPEKNRRLSLEYDGAQRLIWEKTQKQLNASWIDDCAMRYEYDAANNRVWKRRYAAGSTYPEPGIVGSPVETWQSTYNELNQLTRYEHRLDGVTQSVTDYEYNAAGQRSLRVRGTETTVYYYQHDGLLLVAGRSDLNEPDSEYVGFAYDYRGRRIMRTVSPAPAGTSGETWITFSGGTSVAEYSGSVVPSAEYIRGSDWGGGVGGLLYSLRPAFGVAEPRYTHYNGRGDVVLQTDQSAQKQYEAAYEAFGTRTRESGFSADRQRANTKEEETAFHLLNEGQRYRDLETGVWLTRDPAGFIDGPNLYAYVRQNPWSKFDPEGLWAGVAAPATAAVSGPATAVIMLATMPVVAVAAVADAAKAPKPSARYIPSGGTDCVTGQTNLTEAQKQSRQNAEISKVLNLTEADFFVAPGEYRDPNGQIRTRDGRFVQGMTRAQRETAAQAAAYVADSLGTSAGVDSSKQNTPDAKTGNGFGVNDPAVRIQGPWTEGDFEAALDGSPPPSLGGPDLHHAHQMPGSAIHEVVPDQHRGNRTLHQNKYNQGVTPKMRTEDRKLHWWYRAREQGADQLYPDNIYD